jgi:hypothetical protein
MLDSMRVGLLALPVVLSLSCLPSGTEASPERLQFPPQTTGTIAAWNAQFLGTAVLNISSGNQVKFNIDVQRPVKSEMLPSRVIGSVLGSHWTRDSNNRLVLEADFTEGFPDSSRGGFRIIKSSLQDGPGGSSSQGTSNGTAGQHAGQLDGGFVAGSWAELYEEESILTAVRRAHGTLLNGVGEFEFELIEYREQDGSLVFNEGTPITFGASGRVDVSCRVAEGGFSRVVARSEHPECSALLGP